MGHQTNTPRSSSCFSRFLRSANRAKNLTSFSEDQRRMRSGDNDDDGQLVRRLGVVELVLLGIGASIGAGVFVVTGTVAHDVGPGVTISYALAGVSCILNALCYAEMAANIPAVVGGAYLYTYTAFNELTAFLVFSHLMLDYHIGAASIARSLSGYFVNLLELFPIFRHNIPAWIGHGGEKFLGGYISICLLAPIFLVLLTMVLCLGVNQSSVANSIMTTIKVIIIIIVICAGSFKVDVSNWSPVVPHGAKSVLTGATIVFFSYIGFDAVANTAEETKKPQRDLPIGIMASLLICAALYIAVCLVITGMVPYTLLGEDAPLADAFKSNGMKFVSILISVGAVVGLLTTLLVGLYVQSRLYLGLGRDGLLPALFGKVHRSRHTPINSQIWVGAIAAILGGLFNVRVLSHILSVGTLTGYSVVAACVVVLRWKDKTAKQATSRWREGVICLAIVACCGFGTGVLYRFDFLFVFPLLTVVLAIIAAVVLCLRQVHTTPQGFSCPGVPILPMLCIFFNTFLAAQLHYEAWWRFIILSILGIAVYAFYGQYHAHPDSDGTIVSPEEAA